MIAWWIYIYCIPKMRHHLQIVGGVAYCGPRWLKKSTVPLSWRPTADGWLNPWLHSAEDLPQHRATLSPALPSKKVRQHIGHLDGKCRKNHKDLTARKTISQHRPCSAPKMMSVHDHRRILEHKAFLAARMICTVHHLTPLPVHSLLQREVKELLTLLTSLTRLHYIKKQHWTAFSSLTH